MNRLREFGKVWMAASPLTADLQQIRRAIAAGVDAVVLKSESVHIDKNAPKNGTRKLRIRYFEDLVGRGGHISISTPSNGEPEIDEMVYTTSTDVDIELLSFAESNGLYATIKENSPETKVIASFAALKEEDFSHMGELDGDAIEINPRFFELNVKRPYVSQVGVYNIADLDSLDPINSSSYWHEKLKDTSPAEIIGKCEEAYQKFEAEKQRKLLAFQNGLFELQEIRKTRPLIIKLSRQYQEIDLAEYMSLPVNGFTYANSMKNGMMTSVAGVQIDLFGKGSICGGFLQEDTLAMTKFLRQEKPEAYISASGGILDAESAQQALRNGANSVQVCSAIYLNGFEKLEEIVQGVKVAG